MYNMVIMGMGEVTTAVLDMTETSLKVSPPNEPLCIKFLAIF